jgi:hypothetical protein
MKSSKKSEAVRNSGLLILGILILAFFIRVLFSYAAPIKIWDETVYLNLGTDLSQNLQDYSFSNGWSDFIPTGQGAYGYPNAGFRAPLLPYILASFQIFNLGFLINYLMPFIGAVSTLVVYTLGKELFTRRVGLIAALFFALIPLHVEHSGRVLTDVLLTFFVLLSFLSFWKGFEKGNNKHKILFGIFLALALLSRYTALWIFPIFLLYALARGKLLQYLQDKYTWISIALFLILLVPWFIYGYFTYNNPFGPFIHGSIASSYWGGIQAWYHFFIHWWHMFSLIGFIFVLALLYLVLNKTIFKKETYFLLIWFVFFLGLAIYQPHKEERFLLPIIPAMVLLSAYAIDSFKKYTKQIMLVSIGCLLFSLSLYGYKLYTENYNVNTNCYQQVGSKLKEFNGDFLIVSENSSLTRYFSDQETVYYPNTISEDAITKLTDSTDKNVLFVFTRYNSGLEDTKFASLRNIMNKNYDLVFECQQYKEVNWIYLKADLNDRENLIINGSFEEEDSPWVTNTAKFVKVDDTNKGIEPTPLKSAKMTGSSELADLHTSSILVDEGAVYQFKVFADAKQLQSGELGFLVDQYDASNKWLGAKWLQSVNSKKAAYIAALYTADSPNVQTIRIQTYLDKGTKGTVYLDNYQLYKIN